MNTCIIIDDEHMAVVALQRILEKHFFNRVSVLATASSVAEGVDVINKYKPDLVFLDIEMPGGNGFELFEHFNTIDFEVVFITAFSDYAIQAIRKAALDYIVKPINHTDLMKTFPRLEEKEKTLTSQSRIEKLMTYLDPGSNQQQKIALPTHQGFQMERVNHILYCEADHNYSVIHTLLGSTILVSKPLTYLEDLLPKDKFFRIHKSYLINLNYIRSYSRCDGFQVTLDNGKVLDVAHRRNGDFLKALSFRE